MDVVWSNLGIFLECQNLVHKVKSDESAGSVKSLPFLKPLRHNIFVFCFWIAGPVCEVANGLTNIEYSHEIGSDVEVFSLVSESKSRLQTIQSCRVIFVYCFRSSWRSLERSSSLPRGQRKSKLVGNCPETRFWEPIRIAKRKTLTHFLPGRSDSPKPFVKSWK